MKSNTLVCLCYASEDESLMRVLEQHLSVLEQQGAMTLWHHGMVAPGADWQQEAQEHLDTASIILLLVSATFLSCEQCHMEVQRAMKRYHTGEVQVIPVILKPVLWQGSAFGHLKALPAGGKPMTSSAWDSHDEALTDIVEGVLQALQQRDRPAGPISTQQRAEDGQGTLPQELPVAQQRRADVFLCHNSHDKPEVKKVGEALKQRGIAPWLDEWELPPGLPWRPALEAQIASIPAAAVFVGKDGIGPWQNMEVDALLQEFVQRGCPVIPVLLASAPEKPPLPLFLRNMVWVDFRRQDPDPMNQLIWGITGEKPDMVK